MDSLLNTSLILLGLLVRIAIPIAITIALAWLLNRLDAHWQEESELGTPETKKIILPSKRCWVVNNCSDESKAHCPAYARQDLPCWQVFREKTGLLKTTCLGCKVFQEAPVPVIT